jgi:hypothetical protein
MPKIIGLFFFLLIIEYKALTCVDQAKECTSNWVNQCGATINSVSASVICKKSCGLCTTGSYERK